MKTKLYLTGLAATLAVGCASYVTTNAYRPTGVNNGLVYSLPRTRLKVTVIYTIQKETKMVNGIPTLTTETPKISKPITLETILAPDTGNTFVLSGEGLVKDARLDSSFKFSVGDNQLLTSVTSAATDKSPGILQGLVGSGISVAKTVAMAGLEDQSPLKEVRARLEAINDEIALLATQSDAKKLDKFDALTKEQQALLTFATKYRELNTAKTEERDVTYAEVLDLTDLTWNDSGYWSKVIKAPGKQLGPNISDCTIPTVTLKVFGTKDQYANANSKYTPAEEGDNAILYRAPVTLPTLVTVSPGEVVVFSNHVAFAQAGPVNKVEARYKAFAERKTTITFSAATGSIKDYGVDATSSAEAAAKALDTASSKIQPALIEIKKAEEAAEKTK